MRPFRKISAGSNVYVRDPQSFISDCVSITGDVVRTVKRGNSKWAVLQGYVAKMGGGYHIEAAFRMECLDVRIGTPISQISTRPGNSGYAEWCRISSSWGY